MLGKTLLACATFVVAAVAQSQIIAFTNPPANITAGQSVDLTWAGGDGSPVTLTLQQGLPSDLQTVQLITGSATGTSYTFAVPSSLPDASNYAFKIQQGDNPPNYTGMITLTGGSTTGPTLAVSALASSSSTSTSASASASASISATSTVGTNPASGGVISGGSSNGTSSSSNATTTAPSGAVGTGAVASGSAATGTALSRNTTMSIATLTSSSTSSSSSSSAAASTSSSSSSGTSTSSSPAPSSSKTSAAITLATSNFALLCAAVVGIAYLG